MTRERSNWRTCARAPGAHRRLSAADTAEASARALFERVGRAKVCALLKAEHPIDYRFVDKRALLALLARAYARGALPAPASGTTPMPPGGTNVEVSGIGRLLLTDDVFKAGYRPIAYAELRNPPAIVARLVRWPEWRAVVCELLSPASPGAKAQPVADEALRTGLLAGLASGTLALLRPYHSAVSTSSGSVPPADTRVRASDSEAPSLRMPIAVHWLEIALVDEDGDPVGGEAYEIVLPGGERRTGTLGADGKARLDGLVSGGSAKVTFPAIDGREWRAA